MNDRQFTILHDGHCPLCRLEVRWLTWLDKSGQLRFEDIAAVDFDPSQYDATFDELMGTLHGVFADGRKTKGLETFRQAYRVVGWGWLAAPTGWPVLRIAFDFLYKLFARFRVRLGGMFGRSCSQDRCSV